MSSLIAIAIIFFIIGRLLRSQEMKRLKSSGGGYNVNHNYRGYFAISIWLIIMAIAELLSHLLTAR